MSTQSDLSIEEFFNPTADLEDTEFHALIPTKPKPFKQKFNGDSHPLLLENLKAENIFLNEQGIEKK